MFNTVSRFTAASSIPKQAATDLRVSRLVLLTLTLLCILTGTLVPNVAEARQTIPGTVTSDPRIDPLTGRDLANWPPDRDFDHRHLKLEIDIPDMEVPQFAATATLEIEALGMPRSSLRLDARRTMTFSSIRVNDTPAKFTHERDVLTIDITPPLQPGAKAMVRMEYSADEPFGEGVGLNWFRTRPGRENEGAMLYSQGQANWNSYWFPCHDFPNERLSTEIIATVPAGYTVVSNGREVDRKSEGDRVRSHWLQEKPHPAYLVVLIVGKFDIVDVGGADTLRPGLPMPVYGPPGSADALREVFKITPRAIAMFERLLGEPYPWDQYAQIIVRNFRWQGMENTGASTLNEFVAGGNVNAREDLIIHEIVHQWLGNLVTCRSWEHVWLQEGFATLAEALWVEERDGRDAYLARVASEIERLDKTLTGRAPIDIPLVSNRYSEPDDTFVKPEDAYIKGGMVLHMLREQVGNDLFWRATRLYLQRGKRTGLVETDDLRRAFEYTTGRSFERFFDQWTRRPGMPRLSIDLRWDAPTQTLTVTAEQTQFIDADNPAYALRIPIVATLANGTRQTINIDTAQRRVESRLRLPAAPTNLSVDPDLTNLAVYRVTKPQPAPVEPPPADVPGDR